MNLGHFGYLVDGATHTKTASNDRLELLAKTAAKRYVHEGENLNDTIRKFAAENDLNANQIERVCEMANIATHQSLWPKTAEKESVAFPLADAKTITNVVKAPEPSGGSCGCSSMESDYAGPPKGIPASGPSLVSMMGADPENVHNGLGPEPEKKKIVIILQKKAAERQKMKDEVLLNGMQLETLEKQAYNNVKQTVMGGGTFRQIYEAASGSGLGKLAEEYLPKFEERLISETHGDVRRRLEKVAIGKAPSDLVSENLGNISVINGAHPVMVSLDTIKRKTGEIKMGLNSIIRIDDEADILSQKMRELS